MNTTNVEITNDREDGNNEKTKPCFSGDSSTVIADSYNKECEKVKSVRSDMFFADETNSVILIS